MESSNSEINQHSTPKPTLSKSWSELSSHSPSYTGGKVTLCHGRGAKNLYGYEDDEIGSEHNKIPFFLAPCSGDLSIIDAVRGVKVRTIREGCNVANDDQGDDDDESLDTDAIVSYALAPNDCDLITASRNNILRQYDISGSPSYSYIGADGKGPAKVRKVLGRSGHDLPISCMEFHCSGIFFATGSIDGNAKVWDLRGGYATHSFRYNTPGYTIGSRGGLRGSITSLAWCPDITKLWLGVGRDDGTVRVHDLRSHNENDGIDNLVEMTEHVGPVTCMMWAKGRGSEFDTFFSGGRDEVLNTWNIEIISNDASTLSTRKKKRINGSDDGGNNGMHNKIIYKRAQTLPLYESIEDMQLLPNFYRTHISDKVGQKVTKNDIFLATAGSKGVIRIWKTQRTQRESEDNLTKISGVLCIAQQEDKSCFGQTRGGYNGLLLTSHKHQLRQSDGNDEQVFTNDEELVAIDVEHNMSFLNIHEKQSITPHSPLLSLNRTIVGHNDEILDLKIIPSQVVEDGGDNVSLTNRKVAVATNSSQIRLFDLSSFSCAILDGHTDTVLTLDVSPCGNFLATSGKDKTTRVWHLQSHKCVAVATGHTEAIGATSLSRKIGRYEVTGKAAMNAAGSFIITASKDKTLKRWNLPGSLVLDNVAINDKNVLSLSVHSSVRAHEKDINIVSVAPNDSLIATGSQDKVVKVWDSNDFTLKGILKGHKRGVWDCQFSSHDRVIATCSGDKTIKLWSLEDYSCIRTFQGHSAGTLRVRFLSGGLQLITCDGEGMVRLTDIRSSECVFSIDAHDDKIWALDLSTDGKLLVTGAADSRLKVFHDTTKQLELKSRETEERNVLMEQKLSNHLRFKEYEQALDIALEMDKPWQSLKVLSAIVETDICNGSHALTTLQKHVKNWDSRRIIQILSYCRDWNTRARNSRISMLTVKAILTSKAADEIACIEGLPEILEGIIPYAGRHFERIDKLYTSSYLIDFTLISMGDMVEVGDFSTWEKNVQSTTTAEYSKQLDDKVTDEIPSDDEIMTIGESDGGDTTDDSSIDSCV